MTTLRLAFPARRPRKIGLTRFRTADLPDRLPARLPGRTPVPAVLPALLPALLPGLVVVLMLALLTGCAGTSPRIGETPASAPALWARFQQQYAQGTKAQSFKITASLFYSTPKRGNRTLLSFWGNYAYPLRLDVTAGIGASLSHFRDDGQLWVAYFPGDGRAYTHTDAILGQRALGLPFPFNLRELASLLSGDLSGFVPKDYASALTAPDGVGFSLDDSRASVMVLDAQARPVRLAGPMSQPWTLTLSEYPDLGEAGGMARKLDLDLPGEEKAVLRIKSLEMKNQSWPLAGLKLPLPVDTEVIFLDEIGLMRLEQSGDGVGPSQDTRTQP